MKGHIKELNDEIKNTLTTLILEGKLEEVNKIVDNVMLCIIENNYYCSDLDCSYRTFAKTPEEAERSLIRDGGFDINKKTLCPKCNKDSIVFVTTNHDNEITK